MPLPEKTAEQKFYLNADRDKTIREIARILDNAICRRHDFSPNEDILTISSAEHYFNLISSFEMLNPNRNPLMGFEDPKNKFRIEHYFWFLNENAERYHRELCEEGYYGGRE